VEWDAVELPEPVHGEFLLGMERAVANDRARRHRRAVAARALRSHARGRNFQSGLATITQIESGLFDMLLIPLTTRMAAQRRRTS
jgi:Zn-dependent oligopeptidase